MVEHWRSTSEVVRDIGATMERPPTFSHEVKVVVVGSFKIHIEVGVFESWSSIVEEWSSQFTSLLRVEERIRLILGMKLEHVAEVENNT